MLRETAGNGGRRECRVDLVERSPAFAQLPALCTVLCRTQRPLEPAPLGGDPTRGLVDRVEDAGAGGAGGAAAGFGREALADACPLERTALRGLEPGASVGLGGCGHRAALFWVKPRERSARLAVSGTGGAVELVEVLEERLDVGPAADAEVLGLRR